ncbi:MAG: hypothetical protein IPM61_05235 [Chlorobi bacterium]|nr:hypothetical protein [Chlorobiota bacterium]
MQNAIPFLPWAGGLPGWWKRRRNPPQKKIWRSDFCEELRRKFAPLTDVTYASQQQRADAQTVR